MNLLHTIQELQPLNNHSYICPTFIHTIIPCTAAEIPNPSVVIVTTKSVVLIPCLTRFSEVSVPIFSLTTITVSLVPDSILTETSVGD